MKAFGNMSKYGESWRSKPPHKEVMRTIFHDWLDWHFRVKVLGFDGCSAVGRCLDCGRRVLMDSQGNWFGVEVKA